MLVLALVVGGVGVGGVAIGGGVCGGVGGVEMVVVWC